MALSTVTFGSLQLSEGTFPLAFAVGGGIDDIGPSTCVLRSASSSTLIISVQNGVCLIMDVLELQSRCDWCGVAQTS